MWNEVTSPNLIPQTLQGHSHMCGVQEDNRPHLLPLEVMLPLLG